MVGCLDGVVHMAAIGCPMVGAHDVVDAHVEGVVVIAYARSVGGGNVAVVEHRSQPAAHV